MCKRLNESLHAAHSTTVSSHRACSSHSPLACSVLQALVEHPHFLFHAMMAAAALLALLVLHASIKGSSFTDISDEVAAGVEWLLSAVLLGPRLLLSGCLVIIQAVAWLVWQCLSNMGSGAWWLLTVCMYMPWAVAAVVYGIMSGVAAACLAMMGSVVWMVWQCLSIVLSPAWWLLTLCMDVLGGCSSRGA